MSLKQATKVDTNRVELEVEVDAAAFEAAVQKAYRKNIGKISDFRKYFFHHQDIQYVPAARGLSIPEGDPNFHHPALQRQIHNHLQTHRLFQRTHLRLL